MAAGILFIVITQLKIPLSRTTNFLTLCLESTKSILATGLWLWLILDSAYGPGYPYYQGDDLLRKERIVRSAISVILLL